MGYNELQENKIDEFDKLDAIIRLILFMHKHPHSTVSKLLKFRGGQKSLYSAKKFLETNNLLTTNIDTKNKTTYNLNQKGTKIAEHLLEIEKTLNTN